MTKKKLRIAVFGLKTMAAGADIERHLKKLSIVRRARVSVSTGMISVELRDYRSRASIITEEVELLGYSCELQEELIEGHPNQGDCCTIDDAHYRSRVAAIAPVPTLSGARQGVGRFSWLRLSWRDFQVWWIVAVVASIVCALLFPTHQVFWILNALGVAVVKIGQDLFGRWATQRLQRSVTAIERQLPQEALVLEASRRVRRAAKSVRVGMQIVVRAEEYVPLDGVLESDSAVVDDSLGMRGHLHVEKHHGDFILAGSRNRGSDFVVKVTTSARSSFLATVLSRMRHVATTRFGVQRRLVHTFAVVLPLLLAAGAALVGSRIIFYDDQLTTWLPALVSLLVVCTASPLVLPQQTLLYIASVVALRRGMIFRSTEALERAATARTVVYGDPLVVSQRPPEVIHWFALHRLETLSLAASLAERATHPILQAVASKGVQENLQRDAIRNFSDQDPLHIEGEVRGRLLRLMPLAAAYAQNFAWQSPQAEPETGCLAKGHLQVALTTAREVLAVFCVHYPLDHDVSNLYKAFKNFTEHVILVMPFGKEVATVLQKKAVVDAVVFGSLRDQAFLKQCEEQHGPLLLAVTGGAVQLPRGAVMRRGAHKTTHLASADIVCLDDDAVTLARGLQLAKSTQRIVRQNVWLALIVLLALCVAIGFGVLSPIVAAVGVALATILAVLNTLRLTGI